MMRGPATQISPSSPGGSCWFASSMMATVTSSMTRPTERRRRSLCSRSRPAAFEDIDGAGHDLVGHRRGAVGDELQRREVKLVEALVLHDTLEHRRHDERVCDLLPLYRLQPRLGV